MTETRLIVRKPRRYRIIKRPINHDKYECKYIAQYKSMFGWKDIDWSYEESQPYRYIQDFHCKQFACDEVIKEIVI